jgi:hypothetical protein
LEKLKYLGVPVHLNGQNYYIPSLSTRDFRAHYAELSAPVKEGEEPGEAFDRFIPVIGKAIRRNYPDVTDEQLGEWLDLYTFGQAMKAVQAASGLTPVAAGE